MPEYREFFTRYVPSNFHDWVTVKLLWTFGVRVSRPTEALCDKPDPSGLEREAETRSI